ncbi:MAG: nucleotidyltransferase domain-containing protein [Candidatus Magnetomorum sp.]|nr:nucleotidyltransferase domain-containing protein [Candidatus Magnetomorum sp.]
MKQSILEIEPDATIIRYGSRSRGDANEDSDWDFLTLINQETNYQHIEKIRNHLFDTLEDAKILARSKPYVYFHEDQVLSWLSQVTLFIEHIAEMTKK